MRIETKLEELGLVLPEPAKPPPGIKLPFAWARVVGDRAYLSGHGPLNPDGSPACPFGKVGAEISPEEGYKAARAAALAMLASLKVYLDDLDRVSGWLMVNGLVNATPGFGGTTNVVNGSSDLILKLYGLEAGMHAGTATGVSSLPLTCRQNLVRGRVELTFSGAKRLHLPVQPGVDFASYSARQPRHGFDFL